MDRNRAKNKDLFQDFINIFNRQGIREVTTELINRFDQIHAGGLKATERLLKKIVFKPEDIVLELGGGVGGVARLIAKRYGIKVINLDLSWEYSLAGKGLTELCNDCKGIYFINASATACPLKDNSIDVIWLQHVNMNIKDKEELFLEMKRVLKKGGAIIFHEWFLRGELKDVHLPLPWADESSYSHLCTFEHFLKLANGLGFEEMLIDDDTETALAFYKKLLETKAFKNPFFKNRDGERIFSNIIHAIEKGALAVYSGKLVNV